MRVVAIGTEKGGYLLRDEGTGFSVDGPLFPGWKVTAFHVTKTGHYLAALASNWFGAAIHRSSDMQTWDQVTPGPVHHDGRKLEQVWTLASAGDRLYAGVAEAGLFSSDDDGLSWAPVDSLNRFPGSEDWLPGLGGLAAHHILTSNDRLWVGISAVGVFRSDDGGASFVRCDAGVTPAVEDAPAEDAAFCVHALTNDCAVPDRLWRQDHSGVYRTTDAGDTWERIENGLPARFGFVVSRHGPSGRLFVVPLTSDENRVPVDGVFAAYRSDDDGSTWVRAGSGWPEGATFDTVLRRSVSIIDNSVIVGTTGGRVWMSDDIGETWFELPHSFPRILTVDVLA